MNLIALLNPDSAINDSVALKYTVYYYMLSVAEVDEKRNEIQCRFNIKELPERFRFFDATDIKDAVKQLVSDELVAWSKSTGVLTLGISEKGVHKLYGTRADSVLEDYRKLLYDHAERFNDNAQGMNMTLACNNLREVDGLFSTSFTEWTKREFVKLFNVSYVSLYQQAGRAFTGKENGQMGHLIAQYKTSSLFKMVIYYVFHAEKYHKTAMNMGLFLYNKDDIYTIVTGKTAERVKMQKLSKRTTNDEEESFI